VRNLGSDLLTVWSTRCRCVPEATVPTIFRLRQWIGVGCYHDCMRAVGRSTERTSDGVGESGGLQPSSGETRYAGALDEHHYDGEVRPAAWRHSAPPSNRT
jgi:hypothetical protein